MGGFDDSRLRFIPTYDDPGNSYRSAPDARPIAIDYVMHKPGSASRSGWSKEVTVDFLGQIL